MNTTVLKISLARYLRSALSSGRSKTALAADIGLSPQKLSRMMEDQWDYITKDAIERTADYFGLKVSDIFELCSVPFWSSMEESKQCTFLRGSHDYIGDGDDLTIPGSDNDATAEIIRFMRGFMSGDTYADHERDAEALIDRAMNENCIVIGGPRTNAATEILLSRFFGALPFKTQPNKRSALPFCYCWPEHGHIQVESSLACLARNHKKCSGKLGIAVQGLHVDADYIQADKFIRTAVTGPSKDCGLVFVANRPFGTTKNVKLIVLAGFGGVGTFGAAKALIDDFRYLEPLAHEDFVYGVVQAWFTKVAHNDRKTYKRFAWRVRRGGHSPIEPSDQEN